MNNIFLNKTFITIICSFFAAFLIVFLKPYYFIVASGIILTGIIYLYFPRFLFLCLGIFVLFNDILIFRADKISSLLAITFKRGEETVIFICIFLFLLKKIVAADTWKNTVIDIPLLGLVIIALASSFFNRIMPVTVAFFDLFLLLKGFFIFYLLSDLQFDQKQLKLMVNLIFIIAVIIYLTGIIDLIMPYKLRSILGTSMIIDYRFGIPSVQSVFNHPGYFGWFMAFCACFSLSFYLFMGNRIYYLMTLLFASGIILSMRFKPMGGLFAAITTAFVITDKEKKMNLVKVVIPLIFIGLIFSSEIMLLLCDKIYVYISNVNPLTVARDILYITSFKIANDYFPFGTGLGTFGGFISLLYYSPVYSQYGLNKVCGLGKEGDFILDTFWPYILGQFGYFGFVLYVLILFSFFYMLFKLFKKTANDYFTGSLVLGTILVLTESIMESSSVCFYTIPPFYYYTFGSTGIIYSIILNSKKNDSKKDN